MILLVKNLCTKRRWITMTSDTTSKICYDRNLVNWLLFCYNIFNSFIHRFCTFFFITAGFQLFIALQTVLYTLYCFLDSSKLFYVTHTIFLARYSFGLRILIHNWMMRVWLTLLITYYCYLCLFNLNTRYRWLNTWFLRAVKSNCNCSVYYPLIVSLK